MHKRYTLLFLSALLWCTLRADHFAGGTITTRCLGGNFHEVTMQLFRNCSGTPFLPQDIDFANDCGVVFQQTGLEPVSTEEVSPLCEADIPNSTCNGGSLLGFQLSTYRINVFLSPCSRWTISWNACCRNASLNLFSSPGLYIETTLDNSGGACNAAPVFVNDRVPVVCLDQPVRHDGSAVEPDGNTLTYALIDARFGSPAPLPVQYNPGSTGAEPFEGMAIDTNTGTISFLPTLAGVIIVVIEVTERNSEGAIIGTVMRDFLFVVSACSNSVPSVDGGTFTNSTGQAVIQGDRELVVCGTDAFCASITLSDVNIDQELTLTSDAEQVMSGATLTINGTNPVEAVLCWTGAVPGTYAFSITATDDACPVVGSQNYDYLVTVADAPDAGADASINVCENEEPFEMIGALAGTPAPGGQWFDPEGNVVIGTFTPGASTPGNYTYTIGSGSCATSSTLAVILQPAMDPECLTASINGPARGGPSLAGDPTSTHRFWLTAPDMDGVLRVMRADGRLIQEGRLRVHSGTAVPIEVAADHHGPTLLHVVDERTGAQVIFRTFVP